jgi:hypothetical protein
VISILGITFPFWDGNWCVVGFASLQKIRGYRAERNEKAELRQLFS